MLGAFQHGRFNHVPVIEGSNHDEMRLFVALLFEIPSGPLTNVPTGATMLSLLTRSPTTKSELPFGFEHECSFWDPLLGN